MSHVEVYDKNLFPLALVKKTGLVCCFSVLLEYIESGDQRTWKGEVLAFAMLATVVLYMTAVGRFCYHGYNCGMHLRTIVTGMVYRKVQAGIHRLATFFFLFLRAVLDVYPVLIEILLCICNGKISSAAAVFRACACRAPPGSRRQSARSST